VTPPPLLGVVACGDEVHPLRPLPRGGDEPERWPPMEPDADRLRSSHSLRGADGLAELSTEGPVSHGPRVSPSHAALICFVFSSNSQPHSRASLTALPPHMLEHLQPTSISNHPARHPVPRHETLWPALHFLFGHPDPLVQTLDATPSREA